MIEVFTVDDSKALAMNGKFSLLFLHVPIYVLCFIFIQPFCLIEILCFFMEGLFRGCRVVDPLMNSILLGGISFSFIKDFILGNKVILRIFKMLWGVFSYLCSLPLFERRICFVIGHSFPNV